MKKLLSALFRFQVSSFILFGLSACVSHPKASSFHAPAVSGVAAPVQRTRMEVNSAVAELNRLAPHVAPEARVQLDQLRESLRSAQSASEEAQQGLITYATQVDAQTRELNAAVTERNAAVADSEKWRAQARGNAQERDVILILFAAAVSIWIGSMFAGEVMRNFPAPWSLVAAGGIYLVIAVSAYTAGRLVLHSASKLIP